MAFTALLLIQALLVGVAVVLLRPGAADMAGRAIGADVARSDLRVMAGTVVAAATLVLLGVLVLNGPLPASALLVVSALAGYGALRLARYLDRPDVQVRAMARLEVELVRVQAWGRAAVARAGRLGRELTSRARRAGGVPVARRR